MPSRGPQVEWVPTGSVTPYDNNARVHSPAQVEQLAESIREFGWTVPILVDSKQVVLAGHGRLLAAKLLGHDLIPVMKMTKLTVAKCRAYRLADNQLALNSSWDDEAAAQELAVLKTSGFRLETIGFSPRELTMRLGEVEFRPSLPSPPKEKVRVTQEVTCAQCGHEFRV